MCSYMCMNRLDPEEVYIYREFPCNTLQHNDVAFDCFRYDIQEINIQCHVIKILILF